MSFMTDQQWLAVLVLASCAWIALLFYAYERGKLAKFKELYLSEQAARYRGDEWQRQANEANAQLAVALTKVAPEKTKAKSSTKRRHK